MTAALPCLLLPLHRKNILLPSSAVAEIIPYEAAKQIVDAPKWLLGILTWRGVPVPLAHLETMDSHLAWNFLRQEDDKIDTRKYYIAVINRTKKMSAEAQAQALNHYPFFAVLVESAPKLHRVFESAIKIVTQCKTEDTRFLMEVKIHNECALIPHLESLWAMIDALPARLQWFRQIVL